jgi:thiol-disulfide isomerase/thioredoxin
MRRNGTARLVPLLAALALGACGDRGGDAAGGAAGNGSPEAPLRAAPPLASDGAWVKGGPLHLDALRGKKAVLVEVGFSSCKRCRATVPHLAAWSQRYGARGLEVVFVNDGTVSPPLADVQRFVADLAVPFPVLHDERGTTAKAYGVAAYPHLFLIDKRGGIVWDGSPVGREAEVEAEIEKALN